MTEVDAAVDPPGAVREPSIDLPAGYVYGVTRYADVILERSFPTQLDQLRGALEEFRPELSELQASGGGRTPFVARWDKSLEAQGWGKRSITIETLIDDEPISRVRGHEIDMFAAGAEDDPYPGVAVEMEWSNKDPFFDRDLVNFQALHREGALAVGVIVTRGPSLQEVIKAVVRNAKGESKYGEAGTHWNKLLPRVHLGGGGECPLVLVGIESPRIDGIESAQEVYRLLNEADERLRNWADHFSSHREAIRATREDRNTALARLASD